VVVYTLGGGVRWAWSVHLYCSRKFSIIHLLLCSADALFIYTPDCSTNYHNWFSIHQGVRTYYNGIPDYLQVGEHQFVEKEVVKMWITMMLVGW
jgi:hypothetical protein